MSSSQKELTDSRKVRKPLRKHGRRDRQGLLELNLDQQPTTQNWPKVSFRQSVVFVNYGVSAVVYKIMLPLDTLFFIIS